MFLSFAMFEVLDATGKSETFLIFPTDAPHVVVDRLRDVRGMSGQQQVDLGALRFYVEEKGLKIRRVAGSYGAPVFFRSGGRIRLALEHNALPIADNTMGYYSLLLPEAYCGHVHASLKLDQHWLVDTKRLLVSGAILDHRGYLTRDVSIHAELESGGEPEAHVTQIRSSDVYADWRSGPHHTVVRGFLRAANASLCPSSSGVFLCHSHEDKPLARKLAIALAGAGLRVWLDEAEIRVGESLIGKIEAGITDATHLVALISRAAVASRWCQEELRMALTRQIGGKKITVLPILVEDCELPGFLQEKKYADFRNRRRFDESVSELVAALA